MKHQINKIRVSRVQTLKCLINIVLLILYPQIIQTCMETVFCQDVGDESNPDVRLRKDFSVRCWTEVHKLWIFCLALPLFILIGVLFPLKIIINIFHLKSKQEMKENLSLFKYGYFYFGYKRRFFYWEFVVLLRKIIYIAFNIIFITMKFGNPMYQILFLIF